MSSGYSVGVGGGGPAWQRGLGNLQTFLGGLEARKQRRRQEEQKRRQEEAAEKQKELMSKVAWTVGRLPAMGLMGMAPGLGMALGPLAGMAATGMMGRMLGPMTSARSAQPTPQLGDSLAGTPGREGTYLALLRALLGGIPAGIGRIGGPRPGG